MFWRWHQLIRTQMKYFILCHRFVFSLFIQDCGRLSNLLIPIWLEDENVKWIWIFGIFVHVLIFSLISGITFWMNGTNKPKNLIRNFALRSQIPCIVYSFFSSLIWYSISNQNQMLHWFVPVARPSLLSTTLLCNHSIVRLKWLIIRLCNILFPHWIQ